MTVPVNSVPARVDDSERRLSPVEVEAVLGRAVELHVRGAAAADAAEQISVAELLRIGGELGLPPEHIRQALAEVDGGIAAERSWLSRNLGRGRAGASRIIPRGARLVHRELDGYLVETECMVVERRLPGRTAYVPAAGFLASATRAARRFGGRHPLLQAERLEVAFQELDGTSCCVAVAVDLTRKRRELAATGTIGGGVGGTVAAAAAGTFLTPPAALIGLPVAAAALVGSRAAYRNALAETSRRLESLLDRLEYGDLRRGPPLRALLGL